MKYISQRKETGNYCVQIQYKGGQSIYLGTFKTLDEAVAARDGKLIELDGHLKRLDRFCHDRKQLSKETIAEVRRLYDKGYCRSTIMKMLNITDGECDYHIRQYRLSLEKDSGLINELLYTNNYFNNNRRAI